MKSVLQLMDPTPLPPAAPQGFHQCGGSHGAGWLAARPRWEVCHAAGSSVSVQGKAACGGQGFHRHTRRKMVWAGLEARDLDNTW